MRTEAPLTSGSLDHEASSDASRRPRPARSSDSSWASYGMPSPPPTSTRRSRTPQARASWRAAAIVASMWSPRAPASRTFDDPKRCSPSRSRCGDPAARSAQATRSSASIPNLPAPLSPTRRTRSSEAAVETGPRTRIGIRRSSAAAIASSRRNSFGDSTVTARMPARTAARSSSSRLPGPVITIRSAAIPARSAVASSPADATSAPRPSAAMCGDDTEGRICLHRVGHVEPRRQDGPAAQSTCRVTTSRS